MTLGLSWGNAWCGTRYLWEFLVTQQMLKPISKDKEHSHFAWVRMKAKNGSACSSVATEG